MMLATDAIRAIVKVAIHCSARVAHFPHQLSRAGDIEDAVRTVADAEYPTGGVRRQLSPLFSTI